MMGVLHRCSLLCGLLPIGTFASTIVESVNVPIGWTATGTGPNPNDLIHLQVGLKQENLEEMISSLYAVSDPDSTTYGQHFRHDEVLDLLKPKSKANEGVVSWLHQTPAIEGIHSDGHWVDFVTTIESANRLLEADFQYYENRDGGIVLRTTQYSVPDSLADAVDLIVPTTYFGSSTNTRSQFPQFSEIPEDERQGNNSCANDFTPDCIKKIYNIGSYMPNSHSGSRVGFGNFLNQSAIYKDLFQFERKYDIKKQSFDSVTINHGVNNQSATMGNIIEGNLDIQNIIAVAAGLPITGFFTAGLPPFRPDRIEPNKKHEMNEPYLAYFKYLLKQPNENLPQVISHSYSDPENTVPHKYAVRVCNMIAAMGMRGITILFSSGDSGVGEVCVSNNKEHKKEYSAYFPPTCPYATAVGGTSNNPLKNPDHEFAWEYSGGGFSNYFHRPGYQEEAVKTYFKRHVSRERRKEIAPYYSHSGRGYPDVSAHSEGTPYLIIYRGKESGLGGTSASCPVWAGVIGLLNDARLRNGQSPLGFINPFLYKRGYKALLDIKQGRSKGCMGVIRNAGFNTAPGWDPVTGFGTPNFKKLRASVLQEQ